MIRSARSRTGRFRTCPAAPGLGVSTLPAARHLRYNPGAGVAASENNDNAAAGALGGRLAAQQGGLLLALQIVISGVAQGCVYGLVALGIVLIYKATETASFAQGELMMLGAFFGLALMTFLGVPFWAAFLVAVLAMAAFGVLLERVVIRPILGQPAFSVVMLTIGIGYVARGLITMIPGLGTETHTLAVPYKDRVWNLGALVLNAEQLVDHRRNRSA